LKSLRLSSFALFLAIATRSRIWRHLVQAFVEGESADAVPIDRVLVAAGAPAPKLMLPKGTFRFACQD
jgi:hypothetical protein